MRTYILVINCSIPPALCSITHWGFMWAHEKTYNTRFKQMYWKRCIQSYCVMYNSKCTLMCSPSFSSRHIFIVLHTTNSKIYQKKSSAFQGTSDMTFPKCWSSCFIFVIIFNSINENVVRRNEARQFQFNYDPVHNVPKLNNTYTGKRGLCLIPTGNDSQLVNTGMS